MHIGIDCRLPYYRMGGISQYVVQLIPALAAVDGANRYSLLHSRKDARSYVPPTSQFSRRNLWTPCHHRLERWALGAEVAPLGLDILHSPDFIPPAWGAKRRVITIHDLNFLFYPQFLTAESKRYYIDQIRWAVDAADHISADSHATRRDIIEQLDVTPEKVTTVHLAANPLYERPVASAEVDATLAKHKLSRGFILFVGTLEPRKNLPMLIRAYQRMRSESDIDVPLILVGGKGWIYEEIFATIAELGLETHVRHLSGIFDKELAHLYHAAGVLVTPSHTEGFGLPALEAQWCDCPVIVSNRGSLPEIVGEQGIMLDADDEALWAETLARVLTDEPLRRRMVDLGREQAATFSWEKAARETIQIYERVME